MPDNENGRPWQGGPMSSTAINDKANRTAVSAIEHAHAVVVETPGGRVNRRLYLSLHSAEKALDRARERGDAATMLLVELVPVVAVDTFCCGAATLDQLRAGYGCPDHRKVGA